LTRAIELDAASAAGPLVVAIVPAVTIAATATRPAATRQNVSLRRILRRSTITSESSDIEFLLNSRRVLRSQRERSVI